MKKILMIATMAVLLCSCGSKNTYTINGDIKGLTGNSIMLQDEKGDTLTTVTATDGKFTIKGKAATPSLGLLSDGTQPIIMLFLEPGEISVTGDMAEKITVSGTPANDGYSKYNEYQYECMQRLYATGSDEERLALFTEMREEAEKTLDANLDNYFGLLMLSEFAAEFDSDQIIGKLDSMPKEITQTDLGKELRKSAEMRRNTEIGKEYMEIEYPDKDGNMVKLSSLVGEGKYVLIDFWATWCAPCMGEIPHLAEAYEAYKHLGFEIYGVSLDDEADKEKWAKTLSEKNMTWVNVFGGSFTENEAAQKYDARSIPTNFLIGPDGKIIAKNLRGSQLKEKLSEIIGA